MKKLMIALAVVAFAAVSQAAQIKWAVNTASGTGATYANYKVYICSSLATGGFTSESSISGYLLGTSGNSATIKNNRGADASSGTVGGLDNAKSGEMQNFYVVIVDKASSGYWTTTGSAQIFTTETSHTDYSLADASGLLSGAKTTWAQTTTPPGPGPVPEPTSALLLLIGVAGLSLRRRRA